MTATRTTLRMRTNSIRFQTSFIPASGLLELPKERPYSSSMHRFSIPKDGFPGGRRDVGLLRALRWASLRSTHPTR